MSWVLLVEDDPDHRLLLRQAISLLDEDLELEEAIDFREATRWVVRRRDRGDLLTDGVVILDLGLPGPSGFVFLEWLRDRGLDQVPVFVLTASENPMDADHAFNLGARGYFQKPADFRDYTGILNRIFRLAAAAGGPGRGDA